MAQEISIDDPATIIEEMLSTINEFRLKDECFEIRILGKKIFSGYFQNSEQSLIALKSSLKKWADTSSIYFTVNSVKPAAMARGANKIVEGVKITTSDNDIEKIDYLHIDLDPVRPAGISSTKEELELSYEKAKEIKRALAVYPIRATIHKSVPIDLLSLIKLLLKKLPYQWKNWMSL